MKMMNEDEFYEYWREYRNVMNSLPIEVRSNFEGLMMYGALMERRKRFCDFVEKSRKV